MSEDEAFASVSDLEIRWRPLALSEVPTAEVLLEDASDMIRNECPDWREVKEATLRRITCFVVRRAMDLPDLFGLESVQQSAGPYQQTKTVRNPTGDIYLLRSEKRDLGCLTQRAFTISLGGEHR